MKDLSNHIAVDEIALCPLCDNTIESCHSATIAEAHGCKFLVHTDCIEIVDSEEDESETD